MLTGVAAAKYAGPAIVVSFVVSGFACAMAALCYAEFAAMIPVAGSAYSYSYATMGELVAGSSDGTWCSSMRSARPRSRPDGRATLAIHPARVSGFICRSRVTHAPGSAPGAIINLPALLIVMLITYVLYIGISESARLNSIIVGIKLVVIAAVIVVGAFFVKPANWSPFAPMGWAGVMQRRGRYFLRVHRIRRGIDGGGRSRRSESRPAARHSRLAVRLHRALHPGRRRFDRDGAGALDRHERAAGVGVRAARDACRCRDLSRSARWRD